jgi:hypothetical protein
MPRQRGRGRHDFPGENLRPHVVGKREEIERSRATSASLELCHERPDRSPPLLLIRLELRELVLQDGCDEPRGVGRSINPAASCAA